MVLEEVKKRITPPSEKYKEKALARTALLAMPPRAMGRVNDISEQLCAINETLTPKVDRRALFLMAADHGVCAEGVSAFPQSVTMHMVHTMLEGKSAVTVYAAHTNTGVILVDMGVIGDVSVPQGSKCKFFDRKIGRGTRNFLKEPAMSREEAERAVLAGYEIADSAIKEGKLNLVAAGEMGIGNTTPSAAIACVYTGLGAEVMVGRGSGIDDKGYERKVHIVSAALKKYKLAKEDPIGVLQHVGGYEIGGIAGVMLAAAANKVPVVLDGLIATAGAMIACAIQPEAVGYMIAGHLSDEYGHRHMLDKLGLMPVLNLGMRLGEGTGSVCSFGVIEMAAATISEIATLKDVGII